METRDRGLRHRGNSRADRPSLGFYERRPFGTQIALFEVSITKEISMHKNMFWFDRALRIPLGLILLFLALGRHDAILYSTGGVLLATGLVGYCPLTALFSPRTSSSS